MNIIQLKCFECNKIFNKKKALYNYKIKQKPDIKFYCSTFCANKNQTLSLKVKCSWCFNTFLKTLSQIKKTKNHFCNQSCAAHYNNKHRPPQSKETKIKISQSLKKRADLKGRKMPMENDVYYKFCKICGNKFYHKQRSPISMCSTKCRNELKRRVNVDTEKRLGGIWERRKSRSKGEKLLASKLKENNVKVLTNKRMFDGFDADIILPDYKMAIHWNGAWHWKPIAGINLLNKIKARDRLRYEAVERCGYVNYIIIDHKLGKPEFAADIHFRKLMRHLGIEPRPGSYQLERV